MSSSSKMADFCKNEDCPASLELLAYENGDLAAGRTREVGKHLLGCEFCSAEVEFYSHYPQGDLTPEAAEPAQIPAPLYELAEALLKNGHRDSRSLNALLLKETEESVVDLV